MRIYLLILLISLGENLGAASPYGYRYNRLNRHHASIMEQRQIAKAIEALLSDEQNDNADEVDNFFSNYERDFGDDSNNFDEDELNNLLLKRFLFKKKTTTQATTTTTLSPSAGINALVGPAKPSNPAKPVGPNSPNQNTGGLSGLIGGLTSSTKQSTATTTTPTTRSSQAPGSGGLNSLIGGLINKQSTSTSTTTTTKSSQAPGSGGLNSLIGGLINKQSTSTSTTTTTKQSDLNQLINKLTSSSTTTSTSRSPLYPNIPKGNACMGHLCKNLGVCELNEFSSRGYTCRCKPLYSGDLCENLKISPSSNDPCSSSPCKNGGTCTNLRVKHYCSCPKGYEGEFCEKNLGTQSSKNACVVNPCQNNGECHQFSFGQYCQCPATHYGEKCQYAFTNPYASKTPSKITNTACSSNPCKNDAKCEPLGRSDYFCDCKFGYKGKNCDRDSSGNKIYNHGFLMDVTGREVENDLSYLSYEQALSRDLEDIQQIRSMEQAYQEFNENQDQN